MAALAIAAGGALLGSSVGIGANVGWVIGSVVGSLLFPAKPTVTEGPRLEDLAVTSSSYGATRHIGYGTIRTAGNIIWSTGFKERRNKEKVSGKGGLGGPSQINVTYSYSISFSVGFGEGVAEDVLRIWADGKLIFDKRNVSDITRKAGLVFRFYPGSETQEIDPAILADKGALTPAFRGEVMIVFEDLELADYGNRIPNITAEIAYNSQPELFSTGSTFLSGGNITSVDQGAFSIDWKRNYVYYAAVNATHSNGNGIVRVNLNTQASDLKVNSLDIIDQTGWTLDVGFLHGQFAITSDYALVGTLRSLQTIARTTVVRLDQNTLQQTASFGIKNSQIGNDWSVNAAPTHFSRATSIQVIADDGIEDYVVGLDINVNNNNIGIVKVTPTDISYIWDQVNFNYNNGTHLTRLKYYSVQGKQETNKTEGYYTEGPSISGSTSASMFLHRFSIEASSIYSLVGGENIATGFLVDQIKAFTPGDLIPGTSTRQVLTPPYLIYDKADDTIMIFAQETIGGANNYLTKYDPNTDTIVWQAGPLTEGVDSGGTGNHLYQSRIENNTIGFINRQTGWQVNTVTGEILFNSGGNWSINETSRAGQGAYDSVSERFVTWSNNSGSNPSATYFFDRGTAVGETLASITTDLCVRAGLTAADIDVTDLSSTLVPGYMIGRQASARGALEPLFSFFFASGVESDFLLKFKLRGQASVRTITEDELGDTSGGDGEFLKENRIQEIELPRRFSISFMDKDNDYVQQTQSARRTFDPAPTMFSNNEMGYTISAAFGSTEVKQAADKSLFGAWVERVNYDFLFDWSQLELDPDDVITVVLDNGTTYKGRISVFDVGNGFNIQANVISEETTQYVSTVTGVGGTGVLPQNISAIFPVKTILADVPLLRDQDEPASRATNPIYFFMGGLAAEQFRFATLYQSSDGINFSTIGTETNEMDWGTTTTLLGDPPDDNPFITDTVNTLTITMVIGGTRLVSITDAEFLADGNPALLMKANGEYEVIHYRDVTPNADGSFTLSTFLRGRRGSDTMVTGHTVAETFIPLSILFGQRFQLDLDKINTSLLYRSVGAGQFVGQGELSSLTSTHRALKPYAIWNATAVLDGSNNIDFDWVRRTRVGGAWKDLVGSVPLSEDTEEYELEIYDGPGGSLLRTVVGLTSPLYEYLAADITTDFGTAPTVITIIIYQISAQIGRGFAKELTLNVE